LEARLTTLLYKRILVAKSEEVKTRLNPVEFSKEGYGSKSAVLPMMMMMVTFRRNDQKPNRPYRSCM
jgi:hypothetical protein